MTLRKPFCQTCIHWSQNIGGSGSIEVEFITFLEIYQIRTIFSDPSTIMVQFPDTLTDPVYSFSLTGGVSALITGETNLNYFRLNLGGSVQTVDFFRPVITRKLKLSALAVGNRGVIISFNYYK